MDLDSVTTPPDVLTCRPFRFSFARTLVLLNGLFTLLVLHPLPEVRLLHLLLPGRQNSRLFQVRTNNLRLLGAMRPDAAHKFILKACLRM
jgi:hypothetical protein